MPDPIQIPPPGIPPSEVDIDDSLVQALLDSQHPDLSDRELWLFGSGWDNTTYRLGEDLAVRMPRRELGAGMLLKEQRWLPSLAERLPLPAGEPVRIGRPAFGYPWNWSIVRWTDGVSAEVQDPNPAEAGRLAGFLKELHQAAPPEAPTNNWRGGPVADRSDSVEQRLERLEWDKMDLDASEVWEVWAQSKSVGIDLDPTWLHADLHPRNVIVDSGRIVAVIDWGDLCVGDPANDLAVAWMLFPNDVHHEFRAAYGAISDDTWERARGWAVFFGVVMVDAGMKDDPAWAVVGKRTLQRVCD